MALLREATRRRVWTRSRVACHGQLAAWALPRRIAMTSVALLGDSIFDNGRYTAGEPDVISHLRRLLPPPWQATLCAADGATTTGLREQLARVDVVVFAHVHLGSHSAYRSTSEGARAAALSSTG